MPEPIIFPDYHGNSIANLMQTLASSRGGDVGLYRPLEGLVAQPLAEARNVVMLVIDGLGKAHPELSSRTGDYTLVLKDNHVIIDSLPGDNTPQLVDYHGGLSSQEVYVPLILVG